MHPFPHNYVVNASSQESTVIVSSSGLPELETAAPAEFDGPGNLWSPESLLTAAVANCFILSFKAIAKASKFEWSNIQCEVQGILDRVDKVTRFTEFQVNATLTIAEHETEEKAVRLLNKAESTCLVSNSLSAQTKLQTQVIKAR